MLALARLVGLVALAARGEFARDLGAILFGAKPGEAARPCRRDRETAPGAGRARPEAPAR